MRHNKTNKKMVGLITAGFLVAVFLGVAAKAADEKAPVSEEMKAQMEKMQELSTPGAEHAILKSFEGNWAVTSRSWMKPGDKEQKSTGTSSMT